MSRRDPVLHRAAAILFWSLTWTFRVLPEPVAYAIADLLAVPLAVWAFVHDRGARRSGGFWRNLRIVYRPGGAAAQPPHGLLWRWARHMTWLAVDFCRMPRITAANLEHHFDLQVLPELREIYERGRGLIFATGHIGMPDVGGHMFAISGMRIVSVFQPSPVPAVNEILSAIRSSGGQALAPKWGVMHTLKRVLRQGQAVALLADTSSKGSKVYAPFLGTLAATNASPGLLHLATGAPILVSTVARIGRMRFQVLVWDVIEHPPTGDRRADLQAIAERMNAGLSRAILDRPEQWFWHGRRFRHRPPGEKRLPDGLPPPAGSQSP